jgi:hypothetical protein
MANYCVDISRLNQFSAALPLRQIYHQAIELQYKNDKDLLSLHILTHILVASFHRANSPGVVPRFAGPDESDEFNVLSAYIAKFAPTPAPPKSLPLLRNAPTAYIAANASLPGQAARV